MMATQREHREFHRVDMQEQWQVPAGYPDGIEQKILSGALDEAGGTGARTRLLRFRPGAKTIAPFVHAYSEEVYLMSGDLVVGSETDAQGRQTFEENTYACRPPGVPHGPFESVGGCVLLEIHYFDVR
jgi:hypothetical protein